MSKKIFIKAIGWLGTLLLIGTYALNSFGLIKSDTIFYPLLNLIAASALAIRVYADRNYSNLVLEVFWGFIAIIAIVRFVLS